MRLAGVAGVSDPVARDLERDLGLVQRVEQTDCLEPRAVLLGAVAQPAPVYFARVDQPLLLAQQRDLPPVGEREGGVAPFCSGVADERAVAPACVRPSSRAASRFFGSRATSAAKQASASDRRPAWSSSLPRR